MSCKEEAIDTGIRVEGLHHRVAFACIGIAVKSHVSNGRHVRFEQIIFNDVKHLLHLTKDEDSMLREGLVTICDVGHLAFLDFCTRRCRSNTTIEKKLSM